MKRESTGETDGSMNALCDEVRRAASKIQETRNCGVIRLEMPERSAVFSRILYDRTCLLLVCSLVDLIHVLFVEHLGAAFFATAGDGTIVCHFAQDRIGRRDASSFSEVGMWMERKNASSFSMPVWMTVSMSSDGVASMTLTAN